MKVSSGLHVRRKGPGFGKVRRNPRRKLYVGFEARPANSFTPEFMSWFKSIKQLVSNERQATLSYKDSIKYIKIIEEAYNQRSVFAFIDKTNGDILKPATWSAPAKHARGNIFDEYNGMRYMTAYGPAYLR